MVAPTNANPTLNLLLPAYDAAGNRVNVALRVGNVSTDPDTDVVSGDLMTSPGTGTQAVSGTVTANQGTGAAAGTSWRTKGDFTEQTGLSAGSLNADLVVSTDVSDFKSFGIQISGTWSGILTVQISNDNVNFNSCVIRQSIGASTETTTITSNGVFLGDLPCKYLRIRMTSYSSGTANAVLELYTFPLRYGNAALSVQSGTWTVQPGNTANTTPWLANPNSQYPSGAIPIQASSGNVANSSAVATLDSDVAKTTYITGFEITGSGATIGGPVSVTLTGLLGGTKTYTYTATVGVLLANEPLIVQFDPALPASATDTDIVVTCPALGAGNTNNTTNARGYKL